MPFYVSPEQIIKGQDRLRPQGASRVAARSSWRSTTKASLFVAENPVARAAQDQ